jgi:hypothetical protein
MKSSSVCIIAAVASLAAAGAASSVSAQAQTSASREAMIHKCILQAVAQYPRGPDSNDVARTAVYKACMADAGLAP